MTSAVPTGLSTASTPRPPPGYHTDSRTRICEPKEKNKCNRCCIRGDLPLEKPLGNCLSHG